MLGGTYSQGTIILDNGSTAVSGVDVLWNDVLEGDELWPSGHGAMIIGADVVHPFNAITLLTPWPGTSLLGSTYVIVKVSWKRHDVTELQKLWRTLAAELEATGNFIFVEGDEPDPEMGENGQFALKTNAAPWKLWYKEVNVWVPQGIPVGSIWRGEWSAATTYQINDVVGRNGSTYIAVTADNLNKPPESNPGDWDLTSSAGGTGADGGVITIPYVFSTSTAMADPGSGALRLNNATQNAATALALDLIDSRGLDFTSVLASAFGTSNPVRGHIRIHKTTDTTKFVTLAVSSEASPTGFKQYSVSVIGSSGTAPFADLDPVTVNFGRAGDLGSQGIQGIQGIQGPIGNPGGAIALPYTVDGLTTMDSNPGAGKMRFNIAPQQSATVLRFSDTTALGAPVGNQFDAITTASDSDPKVSGRIFVNGGTVPRLQFVVSAVEAKINYHNLTIAVVSASVPDPFPDGASIVVDWTPVGDKGDAATIAVGTTTTGAPGTDAAVTNVGTSYAAIFDFSIPEGTPGQPFAPTYVVPDLAGRAAYDDEPELNVDGSRMSVLVESDSSNGGLPTLYFKQSDASADWSEGASFQAAGAADAVSYDNTTSGYDSITVQGALDETAEDINSKVAKSGSTMTGLLTLSGDPIAPLNAVPMRWASPLYALAYNGMQINGAMDVSQEKGSTATTVTASYVCDNWKLYFNGTMAVSAAVASAVGTVPGIPNLLSIQPTTAQTTLGSGDYVFLIHAIEGWRTMRLAWGSGSALPITIAFWTTHHRTGLHGGTVRNAANTRSYAFTYTQAVADVSQYNVITIPGCTDGVWEIGTNTGIYLTLTMACGDGSSVAPSANSWLAGAYVAAPGCVNGVGATTHIFRITGLVVLPGLYAPTAAQSPYIMRPYDQELLLCQRYFYNWYGGGIGFANGSTFIQLSQLHPVIMRGTPTITGVTGTLATIDTVSSSNINPSSNSVTTVNANGQAAEFRINNYTGLTSGQVVAVQPQGLVIARFDARL